MEEINLFVKTQQCMKTWISHPQVRDLVHVIKEIQSRLEQLHNTEKNDTAYNAIIQKINECLTLFSTSAGEWKAMKDKRISQVLILTAKLKQLLESLEYTQTMPADDLCWHEMSSERWRDVINYITVVEPKHPEVLKKQLQKISNMLNVAVSFVSTGLQETSTVKRNLMIGLSVMYYMLNKTEAGMQQQLVTSLLDKRTNIAMWNLADSWIVTKMLKFMMEDVKTHIVIYVPRTAPHILTNETTDHTAEYSLEPKEGYIQVRILHSDLLPIGQTRPDVKYKRPKTVIFHIHGGGFVCLSSYGFQPFTRRMTNLLNVPIFSVDYRLAPKHPFPEGLDDAWQAYYWLVHNYGALGIKLKNVIVTGDSAGGNFSLGIAYKAILTKIRKPDSLMLIYPAVCCDDKVFKKSLLLALDESILSYGFLKVILEVYIQGEVYDKSKDFFISPDKAEDDLIVQLPKTRFVFGELDPLRDFIFSFIERLTLNNVDVQAKYFKGMIHGAMNFAHRGAVSKAKKFQMAAFDYFRELIGKY